MCLICNHTRNRTGVRAPRSVKDQPPLITYKPLSVSCRNQLVFDKENNTETSSSGESVNQVDSVYEAVVACSQHRTQLKSKASDMHQSQLWDEGHVLDPYMQLATCAWILRVEGIPRPVPRCKHQPSP